MLFLYFLILFSIEWGGAVLLDTHSGFLSRAGPEAQIPAETRDSDSSATLAQYLVTVTERARQDYQAVLANTAFRQDISGTNWLYAVVPDTEAAPTTLAEMRAYPTFVAVSALYKGAPVLVVYPEQHTLESLFINQSTQLLTTLFIQNGLPEHKYFLFDNQLEKIYPLWPKTSEIYLPFSSADITLPGSRSKWASATTLAYAELGREVASSTTIQGRITRVDIYRDGDQTSIPDDLDTLSPIVISYISGF